MSRVLGLRVSDQDYERLEHRAREAGRSVSDLTRRALEGFFAADSSSAAARGTGSGPTASGGAPDFSSDDPDAASAEAAEGETAQGEAPDVQTARVSGSRGGAGHAAGDVTLENAVLRRLQSVPLRDPAAVLAALLPLARIDENGEVRVAIGDVEVSVSDAVPPEMIAAKGGSGSGRRAPRDLSALRPTVTAEAAALTSQTFYERNRNALADLERRGALASTPAAAVGRK